jgi:AGZA family xanthine/uracil permease-like MFS transporter
LIFVAGSRRSLRRPTAPSKTPAAHTQNQRAQRGSVNASLSKNVATIPAAHAAVPVRTIGRSFVRTGSGAARRAGRRRGVVTGTRYFWHSVLAWLSLPAREETKNPMPSSSKRPPSGKRPAGSGANRDRIPKGGTRNNPTATATATRPVEPANGVDRFFRISERGSSVTREVRGGFATFFTMAYIVVLNPLIIGNARDADGNFLGGSAPPDNFALIAAATALVAGVLTILMGVVANYPLAMATGLGLNAFVAFSIASQMSWADAMGLVVIEGVIILVLVLTGFRVAVFRAVPVSLKVAISVGIGLFIAFIGLIDAGIVRRNVDAANTPVPVGFGFQGELQGWPTFVFVVGLLAIIVMVVKRIKGAILIGILGATVLAIIIEAIANIGPGFTPPDKVKPEGWALNVPKIPDTVIQAPDFGLLGEFSLLGSWREVGVIAALLFVFTLLLADFFDTMGTMTAIGSEAGLLDETGTPPNPDRILVVDSVGAIAGGAAAVSSNTSYIESAAGVGEGARTGLASVVTGVLFLLATFVAPLVAIIPYEAATPALVVVGFLMMMQVTGIEWDDYEIAIPAFLTIILMPFAFSITVGIGAGFVSYVLIKAVRGKSAQVHPLLWLVAGLFVLYFAIDPIQQLLGVD